MVISLSEEDNRKTLWEDTDVCLSVFPRIPFQKSKAAVKLDTLLDLRGNIPTFSHISDSRLHEVNALDFLHLEVEVYCVMDRGYLDFERLYAFNQIPAFFVTQALPFYCLLFSHFRHSPRILFEYHPT